MLAIWIKPTIGAATPRSLQIRLEINIDTRIEAGDHDTLSGIPHVPQGRRIDQAQVRLHRRRRGGLGYGRRSGDGRIQDDAIHLRSGGQLRDQAAITGDSDGVENPQRGKGAHPTLTTSSIQQRTQQHLGDIGLPTQCGENLTRFVSAAAAADCAWVDLILENHDETDDLAGGLLAGCVVLNSIISRRVLTYSHDRMHGHERDQYEQN